MRILYGVVGEGMGHATRSRVLLDELVKEHEVHVVVSGRARDYLASKFANVHGIWGLTIDYGDNTVRKLGTLLQNLKGAATGLPENIRTYFQLAEEFQPDVVVSDFETFSYLFGRNHLIPVISVDNMQIINRCAHDPALLGDYADEFQLTKALVKSKLPGCFHYLITSFFQPPIRKERTTVLPSILRPEILAAKPEAGEHLVVYQTASGNSQLPEVLKGCGVPCRIYGYRRDLKEDVVEGNLTFRPFSETKFIDDLRTSRGVITGGGYTLMSEAVYLHKPVLSIPIQGQFEQTLNALYLEKLGYGVHAKKLTPEVVADFLKKLPACARAVAAYRQDGNEAMLSALKAQLAAAYEKRGSWKTESQS